MTVFTAICGSNGSGKSNLMDAISPVLGVRIAYLRSNDKTDAVGDFVRLATNHLVMSRTMKRTEQALPQSPGWQSSLSMGRNRYILIEREFENRTEFGRKLRRIVTESRWKIPRSTALMAKL